jgi:dephospho-CoA kinase
MLLVALTGGIASGKSTVAARLHEHGAVVVDADQVARDVVAPGEPALARIAEVFGPGVIAADGSLDRAALGAIVFADPEGRVTLNGITHPAVLERSRALFAAAATADPDAIVVYDIPLLVEAGRHDEFDLVVVVVAGEETRVTRMVQSRGMTREEALGRIRSQASDAERLAIADVVIDADGSLDETLAQADALWENLRARVGGAA